MANDKAYLGDSVYIEKDENTGEHMIYTDNGCGKENVIYLDSQVTKDLIAFITK